MSRVSNSHANFPGLSPGEVHVWCVPLSNETFAVDALGTLLSTEERERAKWFVFARDRIQYVSARGTLRRLLGAYLKVDPAEIRFSYGIYGKPELTGCFADALRFNLSHAGSWAAYAISQDREVGIDIEPLRNDVPWKRLAPMIFSSNEQAEFAAVQKDEKNSTFLRGWTRKEAYVKGRGEGLSLALAEFDVPLAPLMKPFRVKTSPAMVSTSHEWWLYPVDAKDLFVATVAVEGRRVPIRTCGWSSGSACYPLNTPEKRLRKYPKGEIADSKDSGFPLYLNGRGHFAGYQ